MYLKLDKKLIVQLQTLNLTNIDSTEQKTFNIKQQIQYVKNIHLILQYFQQIRIEKILFEDYQANLFYDGNNFTINLPEIYAKLNLNESSSKVLIEIQDLYLKPYNIYYQGNGEYNLKKQSLNLVGKLDFLQSQDYNTLASIHLQINSTLNNLLLTGSSTIFKDIKFLRPILPKIQSPLVDSWIFDNYSATDIKIHDFLVNIPLKSKNILEDSLKNLYVSLEANNAHITFHSNLPPVNTNNLQIIFQNNALEFYPANLSYQHHSLNGSRVVLKNLTTNPFLQINITTDTILDSAILELLQAYHITLPIAIPEAKIKTNLYLGLDLISHSLEAKGFFDTQNAKTLINSIPLTSDTIQVKLDNELIYVETKNTQYQNLLKTDTSFIINTHNKNLSGDLAIDFLLLSEKLPEFLFIQGQKLPFNVDFQNKDKTILSFPTFAFKAILSDSYSFNFQNIAFFLPFSKFLKNYYLQGGEVKISTQDFKHFKGDLKIQSSQPFLRDKSTNKPWDSLHLLLDYQPTNFTIQTKDNTFKFHSSKWSKNLHLNNLTFFIDTAQISNHILDDIPLTIEGKNSNILFKDKMLLSDDFSFSIVGDEIKGTLKYKNGVADIYKKSHFYTIDAREFGDEFINTFIKKNAFHQGRFFLNANTNLQGVLIGEIKLFNTSINELNILQNFMAFIDTIPALLSLKNPGFNQDGYYIKNGTIQFGLNEEFLAIQSLELNGSSIDIKGKGILSLSDNNLDFYAQLITVKSLSNIINKIPVVNYILLGKEGKIYTNFTIQGTLENPIIQTKVTQDILLSPFNVLKRVITSPFEIFNKANNETME
ncbi:YhdP family protein [Helicobacter mesocricetorum]|uniref:YhdP family protein n=1 Tax=Helicobacter mesocricetorum TaxID=87012 RepID=UPI001F38E696|nr:AsmA-like C-terminal domain-containing protein [Helicobacter mesocricetorum]